MLDLYPAAALQITASTVAGVGGYALARRLPRAGLAAVAAAGLAAIGAYVAWGRDTGWWAQVLPVSSAIVLHNPTPPLAALLAGVIVGRRPAVTRRLVRRASPTAARLERWRRLVLAAVLLAAGSYDVARVFAVTAPPVRTAAADDVVLQTHPSTCSPSAAATLLNAHELGPFTEADLVGPCLTDGRGTPLLGLYRGLALATGDTPLRPVAHDLTFDQLQRRPDLLPAVVSVRLTPELDRRDPRYRQRWGWLVGVTHSVVVFHARGGLVDVGDPGVGRELWTYDNLRDLWVGDVISLQPG